MDHSATDAKDSQDPSGTNPCGTVPCGTEAGSTEAYQHTSPPNDMDNILCTLLAHSMYHVLACAMDAKESQVPGGTGPGNTVTHEDGPPNDMDKVLHCLHERNT